MTPRDFLCKAALWSGRTSTRDQCWIDVHIDGAPWQWRRCGPCTSANVRQHLRRLLLLPRCTYAPRLVHRLQSNSKDGQSIGSGRDHGPSIKGRMDDARFLDQKLFTSNASSDRVVSKISTRRKNVR